MNNNNLKIKYNKIRAKSIASNCTESRFNIVKRTVKTTEEIMIDRKDLIEKYLILLNKKNNKLYLLSIVYVNNYKNR